MKTVLLAIFSAMFFASGWKDAVFYGSFVAASFALLMALSKAMRRFVPQHGQQLLIGILLAAAGILAEFLGQFPALLGVATYLLLPVEADGRKLEDLPWKSIVIQALSFLGIMIYLGLIRQGFSRYLPEESLTFPSGALLFLFLLVLLWKNQPGSLKPTEEQASA